MPERIYAALVEAGDRIRFDSGVTDCTPTRVEHPNPAEVVFRFDGIGTLIVPASSWVTRLAAAAGPLQEDPEQ